MNARQLGSLNRSFDAHECSEMDIGTSKTHLFDLIWEDIIVSRVLPAISLRDCMNLRCASKTCRQIVHMYLARIKEIKLINKNLSPQTFKVFSSTCTRLRLINLNRCSSISDTELIPLLRHNCHLTSLNLSHCRNLSAKSLQPVILYCNNLRTLKLSRCNWLTIGAVEALALHQSQLEDVDISYCLTISENSIQIFIKKFRRLKILSLEGNNQVTDRCLYALAKYSTSLRLLNLTGCSDITDKGIRALAKHCTKLEGLIVRGCSKVTDGSLAVMRGRVHIDRRPLAVQLSIPIFLPV